MNTPADKPDLPEPDDIDYRMGKDDVHWYRAETVRRLLADERRKALESIRDRLRYENMNTSAAFVQSMIDGEPMK